MSAYLPLLDRASYGLGVASGLLVAALVLALVIAVETVRLHWAARKARRAYAGKRRRGLRVRPAGPGSARPAPPWRQPKAPGRVAVLLRELDSFVARRRR